MEVKDQVILDRLRRTTRVRVPMKEWETFIKVLESDECIMAMIETYEVKVLVREDRYTKKGIRILTFLPRKGTNAVGSWYLEDDRVTWDDDFIPFTFEKVGRRKTADETIEQREWEKMCHRPGNSRNPLDSYERVLDPFIRSTDRMERYY